MSNRSEEEEKAQAWLHAQGYTVSRPTWLPNGRSPDFWAEATSLAPPYLWAEVKSIEPDDSTAAMAKFSERIRTARLPQGLRGHAMMVLDPQAIEPSVQWVLKRFATLSAEYAGRKISLLFLQQTRDCDLEYQVEIDAEMPMVVWARAKDLPLNPATAVGHDMLHATARMRTPDGSEMIGPAYRFFEPRHQIECALLLQLDPKDEILKGISSFCGGNGQTRERTVHALKVANRQIKTACRSREAPGLVILTPRGPFADNDQMMQAAMYGHYTVPLQLVGDRMEHGEMYHGLDGVFRRNKNTHISAAVHVRRVGPATFFPNPYAVHPIPEGAPVFAGTLRAKVDLA